MTPEITIACVRAGTKYPARYVEILADMVGRCMPAGKPYKIVCFTDQPETFQNVNNRPLPDVHGWWAKLAMFSPEAFESGERVLFFDLDTILVGLLTDIVEYKGDFAILRDVYRPDGMQSSVMMWTAGKVDHIWHKWLEAGKPEVEGGDQIWIEQTLGLEPDILQDKFPGQFVSYKLQCLQGPPADAKVVFFHGWPKPDELTDGWAADFWKVGGLSPVDLELVCNTGTEELRRNVNSAISRGLPLLPAFSYTNDSTICIVAGGPSIAGYVNELAARKANGQTIWAVNGSGHWLVRNGITPDGIWMIDARPSTIRFVQPSYDCTYYVASQVCPEVFDALNHKVVLWHSESSGQFLEPGVPMVSVGSTVGMKAIGGAYALGCRRLHLYGFDSCYSGDAHHAYSQSQNDGEPIFDATAAGRRFRAAPWMVQQVQEYQAMAPEFAAAGLKIEFHGDGFLPHVARNLPEFIPAFAQRANAVLQRLPSGPIKGAEIGVFTGAMSRCLLSRPDLSLLMVDPWEPFGESYAEPDGAGDWHITLTQEQQDHYRRAAESAVGFAGDRATIIPKRSVDAAKSIPDGILDFVFIDGDHSYEGCRLDIEAWLPKLKPGGLLSGHDYDNHDFPKFGVTRAVNEFIKHRALTLELDKNFTWFVRLPMACEQVA